MSRDDVRTVTVIEDGGGEIAVAVIDGKLSAQTSATCQLLLGAGGGQNAAALLAGQLNGGGADAAGTRMDEHGFAFGQVRFQEKVYEGCVENLRDSRRFMERQLAGNRCQQPMVHGHLFRVATSSQERTDAVALANARNRRADFGNRSGHLES